MPLITFEDHERQRSLVYYVYYNIISVVNDKTVAIFQSEGDTIRIRIRVFHLQLVHANLGSATRTTMKIPVGAVAPRSDNVTATIFADESYILTVTLPSGSAVK